MAKDSREANDTANSDYSSWQKGALGSYNSAMANYTSNLNSQIAAGNPYKSQDYLQNQNLLTSGAMNSANTKAGADLRETGLRTGTNTAAIAAEKADIARQGQRDLTQYTAGRDTQNQDKWQAIQQNQNAAQLAGANSEAGVFNGTTSGRSDSLNNLTSLDQSEMGLWQAGIGAAGAAGAAAI